MTRSSISLTLIAIVALVGVMAAAQKVAPKGIIIEPPTAKAEINYQTDKYLFTTAVWGLFNHL